MPVEFHDVLRRRRVDLGLTQARLAEAAHVDTRQLARYEKGTAQPTLPVAARLADALDISLSHLAGYPNQDLDLSGRWWAAWQTTNNSQPVVHYHQLNSDQDQRTLLVRAVTRGASLDAGGYLWRGELQLRDNEILMGWYEGIEGAIRSKGTMYFVLHPQGLTMTGRWVGLSYDGPICTGWAAMAREEHDTKRLIDDLIHQGGT